MRPFRTLLAALLPTLLGCMAGEAPGAELRATSAPEADAAAPEPTASAEQEAPNLASLDAGGETAAEPELAAEGCAPARPLDLHGAAPDMLIVLDRSLSMSLNRRWESSKQAVKTITRDFGGLLRFGMSVFPGSGGECAQGRLDVPLALDNGDAISTLVDQTEASGLTPTGAALNQALRILSGEASARNAYVLLVTDGEPNCHALPLFPDTAQQDAARAAVRALREKNIPTYVIGYQIDAAHQGLMNDLAVLGGTSSYRPVASSEQIVATFREITKEVVKCSFDVGETPDARRVRVEIDGQAVALGASDGWKVEGQSITLQGAACAKLQDGRGHSVSAQLECGEVVLD